MNHIHLKTRQGASSISGDSLDLPGTGAADGDATATVDESERFPFRHRVVVHAAELVHFDFGQWESGTNDL